MQLALNNILSKIFVNGFYKAHAGLFLFAFLVMAGVVPPEQLLLYHRALMLAFVGSPLMMGGVFVIWLLYTLKCWHYIAGKLFESDQQFLFYSATSFSESSQFKSWFYVQLAVLLPVVAYGLVAVGVGLFYHFYLIPVFILLYLFLLTACSASLYRYLVNRLVDGSKQTWLLKVSNSWRKPYFSLYVYHVFDQMKFGYIIIKALSWLVITGVFYLFADVSRDVRVAGIAMLAVITAHTFLIFNDHVFEDTYLSFSRNLPYNRFRLFLNSAGVYFLLLLPEVIWLFSRFNPIIAVELLLLGISAALLFRSLLYWLGPDMDKYLQWILGLFVVLFWIILFRLIWMLIPLNLFVAWLLFYSNYYKYSPAVDKDSK
jgi:hypothetical protein